MEVSEVPEEAEEAEAVDVESSRIFNRTSITCAHSGQNGGRIQLEGDRMSKIDPGMS